jgi:hypothetical protein
MVDDLRATTPKLMNDGRRAEENHSLASRPLVGIIEEGGSVLRTLCTTFTCLHTLEREHTRNSSCATPKPGKELECVVCRY